MDYQNRVGSKKGSGGIAGDAETNQARRERLKQLMLSNSNLDNDPYLYKNNVGILECRLCATTHTNEVSYVNHTRGKRHQLALLKRAEIEKKRAEAYDNQTSQYSSIPKRHYETIGIPAYKVTKVRDPVSYQRGLSFQINCRSIKNEVVPMYRIMSTYEQQVEPVDKNFQYLIVTAEPYENTCFKIPADPIDTTEGRIWDYWDQDTKEYFIQLFYLENDDADEDEQEIDGEQDTPNQS